MTWMAQQLVIMLAGHEDELCTTMIKFKLVESGSGSFSSGASLLLEGCIHPSLPINPIHVIGSYKTPIIGQKRLHFL